MTCDELAAAYWAAVDANGGDKTALPVVRAKLQWEAKCNSGGTSGGGGTTEPPKPPH